MPSGFGNSNGSCNHKRSVSHINPENRKLNVMPNFRANEDEMLFDISEFIFFYSVYSMKNGCQIKTIRLWFVVRFQEN